MIATLDDLDVEGTTVGVRVDVNSPIDDEGGLADDARLRAHVDTLSELLQRGGRVVVAEARGDDRHRLAVLREIFGQVGQELCRRRMIGSVKSVDRHNLSGVRRATR